MVDIRSPECKWLRDLPEGYELDQYPKQGTVCRDLAVLRFHHTTQIRSVEEYKSFVRKQQIYTFLQVSGFWLITVVAVYILGWSTGWIVRGFRKKKAEANLKD
jgi:hypothetical protein